MKKVIVGMMVMGLMCAGAQAMVLDTMDNIAATQWVETRGTTLMQQSTMSHDGSGGSMKIAFSQAGANVWDIVPQRYFYIYNPPFTTPPGNGLDLTNPATNTITFWTYKATATDRERVVEVLLYDAYGTPGSPARFAVTEPTTAGWVKVVAPKSDFTAPAGFHWEYIQTFQFWTSTWDTHGGDLYIDDLQLVPEPATMGLLGLGGLVAIRRKR